jgi:hypothetical protein
MNRILTFEQFVTEKFNPLQSGKKFSRLTYFEVLFQDWKGKYKEENESALLNKKTVKDFQTAKKITDTFCKKNKIKQKPEYREPGLKTSGKITLGLGGKNGEDYKEGKNLQPIWVEISKLETAQSSTHSQSPE